jgi:hypothetical protein
MYGTCCVSTLSKSHASLGNWVRTQRSRRRSGQLTDEQIRILDKLGFVWDMQDELLQRNQANWDSMHEALAAYQRAHGHCRVPRSAGNQSRLAHWVITQRCARRKGNLSAERIRRLDELGFSWGETTPANSDSTIPV